MSAEAAPGSTRFACLSCEQPLLSWDPATQRIEVHQRIGLWADYWTGAVRLVCRSCDGSTDVLPPALVEVLRTRLGLAPPVRDERRRTDAG